MATSEVTINRVAASQYDGGGTIYPVQTNSGDLYVVYIDALLLDVMYKKSTDGGFTWGAAEPVFAGTAVNLSVWYDRWSGVAADVIHMAYTETGGDDTLYRSLDTSSDTLGTQTTIFSGTTTAAGGTLSITRARGGNLYCRTTIDDAAEGGFYRSTDAGATWGARSTGGTISGTLSTDDLPILLPGWAADNQDIMMIFWDASASELLRCLYDDSGDSWAEASISASIAFPTTGPPPPSYPHFAATVDTTNSQNLLVAWTAIDTLNADLLGWKITESAITALTDVVNNSTDDQGLCAIGIDTDTQDWHVFYGGATDGSSTFSGTLPTFFRTSTDDGATWGSETQLTVSANSMNWLACAPRFATNRAVLFYNASVQPKLTIVVDVPAVVASSGGQRVYGC
jgi:hypothetical protein